MRHPIVEEDLRNIIAEQIPWQEVAGQTILITGANGLLASCMTEALLYLNEVNPSQRTQVIALVRDRQRAESRFANYRGRDDLRFLVQDVTQPLAIDYPIHYIIHAASHASPKYFQSDPVGTLAPNMLGTLQLLELARTQPLRSFLFFSSGEVYGRLDDREKFIDEHLFGPLDPMQIRACYGEGKRIGEAMCAAWWHQYRIPTKVVRPAHVYGPGMRLDDGRVCADFVAKILERQDIVLNTDGSSSRVFCYLADAVRAFFRVLFCGENGTAYNIGDATSIATIRELADLAASLFPERGVRVMRNDAVKPSEYINPQGYEGCQFMSRIHQLGWRPAVCLAEGLRRSIQSYQ